MLGFFSVTETQNHPLKIQGKMQGKIQCKIQGKNRYLKKTVPRVASCWGAKKGLAATFVPGTLIKKKTVSS